MILDSLENSSRYELLHPAFKKAFDFLRSTDLSALKPGKIELEGDALFVNCAEFEMKQPDETAPEIHRDYIDIQLPLSGSEQMGYLPASELHNPAAPYQAEQDIQFFNDPVTTLVNVQPGQFVIFFPEDAHQPGLGTGMIRKLVVKVRV